MADPVGGCTGPSAASSPGGRWWIWPRSARLSRPRRLLVLQSEAAREAALLEAQAGGEEPAPNVSRAAAITPEGRTLRKKNPNP